VSLTDPETEELGSDEVAAFGRLVDVPFRSSATRRVVGQFTSWLLFFATFWLIVALTVSRLRASYPWMSPILCGVVGGALACVVIAVPLFVQRWRARRLARAYVLRYPETDLEVLVRQLYDARPHLSKLAVIDGLTAALSAAGRTGDVVRLCDPSRANEVRPLEVAIEPRPLDESDASFLDLSRALEDSSDDVVSSCEKGGAADGASAMGVIARNIRLKEGRAYLALIGVLLLASSVDAVVKGGITISLVLWSLVFVGFLFWPATDGFVEGKWFVLPRAIVIDFGGRAKNRDIRVLYRSLSALSVYQTSSRKWKVVVAAYGGVFERGLTTKEVELLLACWLSSQQPPDYEKIEGFLGVSSE